ncbi:MAG: Spy/CpxP family protein refolding chaperone [Castellaniella sp.]|nr:Spy/CpxP family protein refolding chaperone [Castellaniella sp.]
MKKYTVLVFAAGLLLVTSAWSQPYSGRAGMMGGAQGSGGYGAGMMGGEHGPSGYGMGPGMMGSFGMGQGMLGGYGPQNCSVDGLDLTSQQRTKIEAIRDEFGRKQWDLMGKMRELSLDSSNATANGKFDEQAARKKYDEREGVRKQMFESSLDLRKQIDAVLTDEQRQKLCGPRRSQ